MSRSKTKDLYHGRKGTTVRLRTYLSRNFATLGSYHFEVDLVVGRRSVAITWKMIEMDSLATHGSTLRVNSPSHSNHYILSRSVSHSPGLTSGYKRFPLPSSFSLIPGVNLLSPEGNRLTPVIPCGEFF